jgi:uncharacterized phosphosugar-binding protein
MYLDSYFRAVNETLERIRATQRDPIERAGELVARSLAERGAVSVMDTGHLLRHEAFIRAGGLVALTPFAYEFRLDNPIELRAEGTAAAHSVELERRTAALALDQSKLRRGDVLIINSNSGRTVNVVELGLLCKDRGINTVAISSTEQMLRCEAVHPSGKKLFEVADIGVDNCAPYGDAAVEVRDNERMCPMSGIASAYVLWAIQAEAVQRLQARGLNPTIYRSLHVGGQAFVEEQRRRYLERGL